MGIKSSLVADIRGRADGAVGAVDGATPASATTFAVPAVEGQMRGDDHRFSGRVDLTGHHGMLYLEIRDPAIEAGGAAWLLAIADPDRAGGRLRFADIDFREERRGALSSPAALSSPRTGPTCSSARTRRARPVTTP